MRCVFAAALSATLIAAEAAPADAQPVPVQTVFVRGKLQGGGITRADGGRCYVITLDHVLRGRGPGQTDVPDPFIVADNVAGEIQAQPLQPIYAYYVLQLAPADRGICTAWPRVRRITNMINAIPEDEGKEGYFLQRLQNGNLADRIPVRVWRDNNTYVRVQRRDRVWSQGMSGGLIYVDEVPIAMMEVTCDSEPQLGAPDRCINTARGLRLDEINDVVYPYLRSQDPPSGLEVYGSILAPGLGQHATRRWRQGLLWTGATALTVAAVSQISETRTEMRTFDDPAGIPRLYPYRVREYQYRGFAPLAAVWLLGGVLSTLETRRFVHDKYQELPPDSAAGAPRTTLRVAPSPVVVDGAVGMAVSMEVRF
jgi:hypothetical protein